MKSGDSNDPKISKDTLKVPKRKGFVSTDSTDHGDVNNAIFLFFYKSHNVLL